MHKLFLSLTLLAPLCISAAAERPSIQELISMADNERESLKENWEKYRQIYWESPIYELVNSAIPQRYKSVERCCLIEKVLKGFVTGEIHTGSMGLNINFDRSNELRSYLYCQEINFFGEKATALPEAFYKLLPEAFWARLDVSQCAALTEQSKERIKKAWLAAKRDIKNLILPASPVPASAAVDTKDQKSDK